MTPGHHPGIHQASTGHYPGIQCRRHPLGIIQRGSHADKGARLPAPTLGRRWVHQPGFILAS
eukprot:374596-Alexandrium_andersonii.AAC.1